MVRSKAYPRARVSVAVLEAMLAPYMHEGHLTVIVMFPRLPLKRRATVCLASRFATAAMGADINHSEVFRRCYRNGRTASLTQTEFVTGRRRSRKLENFTPALSRGPETCNRSLTASQWTISEAGSRNRKASRIQFWKDYVPKLSPPWTGRLLSWSCPNPQTLRPREFISIRERAPRQKV